MMYDKSAQGIARETERLLAGVTGSGAGEIVPAASRTESTVAGIKRYIIRHGLRSGDPLPTEATLCEDLGVSRTSVREALRRLEALDIVRSQQGRGSFVGAMSLGPMVETLVLRHATDEVSGAAALREVARTRRYLDLGMARDVCAALGGSKDVALRASVDAMAERAGRGETYMDHDITFHEGLAHHLGNDLVRQLVRATWMVHQTVIPKLGPQMPEALHETALTHRAMLDAAEAGDVEAYRRAVEQHYAPLERLIDTEVDHDGRD